MKRYVVAMAIPRKEALAKINNFSEVLTQHLVKCAVYGNSLHCLDHWIGEVAAWLYQVNKVSCKTPLKAKDYLDNLFGSLGDERSDCEWNVEAFKNSGLRKFSYPDFEITEEMIDDLFAISQRIIKEATPVLVAKYPYTVEEWIFLVKNCIIPF